jgi:hypothetical protein
VFLNHYRKHRVKEVKFTNLSSKSLPAGESILKKLPTIKIVKSMTCKVEIVDPSKLGYKDRMLMRSK